jgi:dTDP-4-dehydrorhamnose reductase
VRIVVTGAKGQLGVELVAALRGSHAVVGLDLPEWDMTGADVPAQLADLRPDWIIHAAAATDVDGCERDPAFAERVNGHGTRQVAEGCRLAGAGMTYLSTDFVFDGVKGTPYLETDTPAPLSAYGRSKLSGEQAVQAGAPRWAIARTAWLFGVHGKNFVKTIVGAAAAGKPLRVVHDQVGSPTCAADLAGALAILVGRQLTGIYHLTNSGACSWFEFTREILTQSGFASTPLTPIASAELDRPARRPAYSVLAPAAWQAAGERPLRPWPEALADMLAGWRATGEFPTGR